MHIGKLCEMFASQLFQHFSFTLLFVFMQFDDVV